MMRILSAERLKLRRSMIWLALAALPLVSAVLGTLNYMGNRTILTGEWFDLWTQHSLFYCLLFAHAVTGVYAAYLMRLEHLDHNWNMVLTMPVACGRIFAGKLAVLSALTAVTQVLIGFFYVLCGLLAGFTAPLPLAALLGWLARGWCALTAEGAILLCAALAFRSFAIPVCIGALGGLTGLAVLAKGFGGWYPFSLLSLAMCAQKPDEPMQCSPLLFWTSTAVFFLLAFAWGTWAVRRSGRCSE